MRRFALLLGVALSLITTSAAAQSCDGFVDVLASSPFCPDVTWMKTYGITKGCDATHYCPTDNVSRLQMAAFMHRLGENPAFVNGGNAFGTAALLGTTDNNSLIVLVNNQRAMLVQTAVDLIDGYNPNIVNGMTLNSVAGVAGATIAGGGGCYPGTGGICTLASFNQVTGSFGTVGGGTGNAADSFGTVAGGQGNTASGTSSTVAGGYGNKASGASSTVPGGDGNTASGSISFAAGFNANADQDQCFVFANWSSTPGSNFSCLGTKYIARFGLDHGLAVDYHTANMNGSGTRYVYFGDIDPGNTITAWNNAKLTDAGVWVNGSSSKISKTDFAAVDTKQVLEQVASLPITTWRFKLGENDVRHMGPMAEDFWASFQIGYGPQTIADLDARGVALAAIQGLNAKVDEQTSLLQSRLENQLEQQAATIGEQQREIAELSERVQKAEILAADVVALKAALAELQHGRETVAVK